MGLVLFHGILEFWVWGVRIKGKKEKEFLLLVSHLLLIPDTIVKE
jgi:hypothetical protein